MTLTAVLAILSRWLHLTTAAVVIGGVFYARIVVPIALRGQDADGPAVRPVLLRARRAFKMVVHTAVLFMLATGTYNWWLNTKAYHAAGPVADGLIGVHFLLGLVALGLLLWLYIGPAPRATYLRWMAVVLGTMVLSTAVASVLKYAREHPPATPARAAVVPVVTPAR